MMLRRSICCHSRYNQNYSRVRSTFSGGIFPFCRLLSCLRCHLFYICLRASNYQCWCHRYAYLIYTFNSTSLHTLLRVLYSPRQRHDVQVWPSSHCAECMQYPVSRPAPYPWFPVPSRLTPLRPRPHLFPRRPSFAPPPACVQFQTDLSRPSPLRPRPLSPSLFSLCLEKWAWLTQSSVTHHLSQFKTIWFRYEQNLTFMPRLS